MISGWGRSAGAVIPALGSGRYSPGPNIVLPSWRKGSDPHFTLTVFWGQPGALATVSYFSSFLTRQIERRVLPHHARCERVDATSGPTGFLPTCVGTGPVRPWS